MNSRLDFPGAGLALPAVLGAIFGRGSGRDGRRPLVHQVQLARVDGNVRGRRRRRGTVEVAHDDSGVVEKALGPSSRTPAELPRIQCAGGSFT